MKSCDPKQESEHLIYLDANNLYGYAMLTFLPISRDSNGEIPNSLTWINIILTIVQKDELLRLILNIRKSYKNYTTTIL